MTRWKNFITKYGHELFKANIVSIQLSDKDFKWIKKEVVKAKKEGVEYNKTLIGHIQEEYKMPGVSKSFNDFLCAVASSHPVFQNVNRQLHLLSENKPLFLHSFWVNYMKKHEFNPPHNHQGLYSFVIFVKIPYDLKKEENYFSKIRIVTSLEDESNTSKFTFLNTDYHGDIKTTVVPVDKSFEGKMFMFPSKQLHMVNPFYTSDNYRITVSGNLKLKV